MLDGAMIGSQVMLILGTHWPGSEEPHNPSCCFRMSIATIVGGIVAYPINHWLVVNRLKHGCMTLPGSDTTAPGLGLVSPEPSMMMDHGQLQHATSSAGTALDESDHVMTELPTGRATAIIAGTFAILLAAVWLTNLVVPVRF